MLFCWINRITPTIFFLGSAFRKSVFKVLKRWHKSKPGCGKNQYEVRGGETSTKDTNAHSYHYQGGMNNNFVYEVYEEQIDNKNKHLSIL